MLKSKNVLLKLILSLIVLLGLSLIFNLNTAEASVDGLAVFDYKLYADTYSDLYQAYGYDEQALYNHYITYGLNEGRIGSLVFNQKYYVNRYSDLSAAYGTNYAEAFNHFLTYGISEGRVGSITFDSSYYLSYYSDLKAAYGSKGYENAMLHYLTYGISEGRRGSLQFDVSYYLNNNSDLKSAFGSKGYRSAIVHFIQYGLSEGRATSSSFILSYYKANYSDLKSAFGSDNQSYFIHYMNYGKAEGRIATYLITSSSTDDTSSDTDTNTDTDTDSNTDTDDEDTEDTYVYYTEEAEELCNLINSERSSLGLNTLSISSSLTSSAEDWAYTMAVNGAISHNYYGVNASEIVLATTTSSASTAWSVISNSSNHYTIATLSGASTVGAACVYDGVGGYYWCVYVSFYD